MAADSSSSRRPTRRLPASVPAERQSKRRLFVAVSDGRGRPMAARDLAGWLGRVAPRAARGEVAVAIVGDASVRRLNGRYRGIDRITDVLAFPAGPAPAGAEPFLGDIVIAKGQAARQAARIGHPLWAELRVLALHGLLHLLGHDHERDDGAMARVEARLRRKGGLGAGLIDRGHAR
jgi:probable rRNA maturation factor